MKQITVCLILFLVLCAPAVQADGVVRVGALCSDLDDAVSLDKQVLKGVLFAADEINGRGGLLGKRLEMVQLNTHNSVLGARQAAKDAVEQGLITVICIGPSSQALTSASVLQKAGIPMIASDATNPEVTLVGNYIFRVCFTDSFQGKAMANFALNHLGARTAAVFTNVSELFSRELARIFIRDFSVTGKVLWEGDYSNSTADFSALLKVVKTLDPDVVFAPGYDRDSSYIIKQAGMMGMHKVFLGGDGWNIHMAEYTGESINGNYFCDHWHPESPGEKSLDFLERFSRKHGPVNMGRIALAYDSVLLLADAVKKADSLDRTKIREALAATRDFEGVTGSITLDENGDPIKSAVILRFENNKPVYFMTVNP